MNSIWHGVEELLVGIVGPILLSSVATVVYIVLHGWSGLRNALATWVISCFMGVLAYWTCLEYAVSGAMSAVLISMTALLSHTILDILFHPQIRAAALRRLTGIISGRHRSGKISEENE